MEADGSALAGDQRPEIGSPAHEDEDLEHVVLVKLLRLNAAVVGIVAGLLTGLSILLVTVVLVIKGGEVVGPHLRLLGQLFVGYDVTILGGIVGFLWGTLVGFIAGYVFARVYNALAGWREGRRHRAAGP
jgi:hypothetical protein